jgi:hypothetical protein
MASHGNPSKYDWELSHCQALETRPFERPIIGHPINSAKKSAYHD